jgi:TPR repeat protein
MVWYGDGTAVDMGKSRAWLQKAAAAGHAGARETPAEQLAQRTGAPDRAYSGSRPVNNSPRPARQENS